MRRERVNPIKAVVVGVMAAFYFTTGCTSETVTSEISNVTEEKVLYEKYDLGWCSIHRKGDEVIAEVKDVDYIPEQAYADVIYVAEKYFGEVIDIYKENNEYGLKDRTDYKKGEKDKRYIIVYKK